MSLNPNDCISSLCAGRRIVDRKIDMERYEMIECSGILIEGEQDDMQSKQTKGKSRERVLWKWLLNWVEATVRCRGIGYSGKLIDTVDAAGTH